jgi:hypothetical protein
MAVVIAAVSAIVADIQEDNSLWNAVRQTNEKDGSRHMEPAPSTLMSDSNTCETELVT